MKKRLALWTLILALCSPSALTADADTETALWPAYDPVTGLWGYIDEQGAWGIAPQWERTYHFHDGCAIVDTMDVESWEGEPTQGIIDETGAYLLEPAYWIDDACCYYGAGALYLVNRFDEERGSGWFSIPNRYFSGLHWTECYAWSETPYILINNDYGISGLADRATGEIVVPMEYSYTGLYDWALSDGFIVAQRDGTDSCELIEIGAGPVALPEGVWLDYVVEVSDGLVPYASEDGLYGYINTSGEIEIPAQFDSAQEFRDGYADVGLLDEVRTNAIIDRNGNVIISELEVYYGVVAEALFVEWPDDTWGLVEPDGTVRCRYGLPEGIYDVWLYDLAPDAPLRVEYSAGDDDYLYALLSRDGKSLSEPRWTWLSGSDLCAACEDGEWVWSDFVGSWSYVDPWGNPVLPAAYTWAEAFDGALARVCFDEATDGYINRAGEVVYQWPSAGAGW